MRPGALHRLSGRFQPGPSRRSLTTTPATNGVIIQSERVPAGLLPLPRRMALNDFYPLAVMGCRLVHGQTALW